MKSKTKLWLGGAALVALMAALVLLGLDRMGIGPNVGLPFGYYGKFNRVLAHAEANPKLEVIRTTLHRDAALEDFYMTILTHDDHEVRLRFEEAHTRPLSDLLQELEKVGAQEGPNKRMQPTLSPSVTAPAEQEHRPPAGG
ncbi:hypothetical protein N8646_00700 [bacterium]|nr:hypothetical protein [bacterium]MDB2428776.1 hypothetical protein [Akkermansiaceae bacterium]